MLDIKLYMVQRITALIMAPLTLGHLAIMIYAVQGGLSADEILGRTAGSVFWFLYYATFVIAVSLHSAIGLRVIVFEVFGLRDLWLRAFTWAVSLTLLLLGARAVFAVTML